MATRFYAKRADQNDAVQFFVACPFTSYKTGFSGHVACQKSDPVDALIEPRCIGVNVCR